MNSLLYYSYIKLVISFVFSKNYKYKKSLEGKPYENSITYASS